MTPYLKFKSFEDRLLQKHAMKEANEKIPSSFSSKLSGEELAQIDAFWGGMKKKGLVTSSYSKCFPFYKFFHGIADYHFVPSDFYYLASSALNARWGREFCSHKANLRMFIPKENRPKTILYNIYGHFYDADDNIISSKMALDILKEHNEFVYKVAVNSGSGKGVRKFTSPGDKQIESIINTRDFIVQEILRQNDFFSRLNDSSVNTILIESLNLNDRCTVLSAFVRIVAKGSFVDNISGREGMVVGVNEQGILNQYGLTKRYVKVYNASSGLGFENLKITNFDQIKAQISSFHKEFPSANLINWDIAIDENGEIIVLEINLSQMNPLYHQIFNGPIFHDRFEEVVSFMRHDYL